MINIFHPAIFRRQWLKQLGKVFKTRWIGQAEKTAEFEKQFAQKYDYEYCIALNSGTAGLELAYKLAGIGKGDKVITPVLTCTATNIPLLRLGAEIVFCDINYTNWTASYSDIKSKLKGVKAIVLVNLGGLRCNEQIYRLAERNGIKVIVDACQSLGIEELEGDYVVYSFQAIKHFTTGDGGMLCVRNKDDYERAKKLRWFGIDREKKKLNDWQPYKGRMMTMDIEEAGYKFHMNDIQAVMGLVGLKNSDKLLKHRNKIADIYDSYLNAVHKVRGGSYWLYGIVIPKRHEKAIILRKQYGIETNMAHLRNDIFDVFGGERQNLEFMNKLEKEYLYIPLHQGITVKQAHYIGKSLKEVIGDEVQVSG